MKAVKLVGINKCKVSGRGALLLDLRKKMRKIIVQKNKKEHTKKSEAKCKSQFNDCNVHVLKLYRDCLENSGSCLNQIMINYNKL